MKDTAVDPAGLFDVRRQRRLLDGLVNRFRGSLSKQQMLLSAHAQQRSVEEAQMSNERATIANECRIQRRAMLDYWDNAEEQLTRNYETKVLNFRRDLSRLDNLFRQKANDEKQGIERKVTARHQAITRQFENRKNQPGQQNRKEIKKIDDTLEPIQAMVREARELALRRLDHVPEVGPPENPEDEIRLDPPGTIEDAVAAIRSLEKNCRKTFDEMKTTTASRIIDSYFLPILVLIFLIVWAVAAYLVTAGNVLAIVAGVIPAGLLGFTVYLAMMLPLKRTTKRIFPTIERLGRAAEDCATSGKRISTEFATEALSDLTQRRDNHMESTKRWMNEQLSLLEQRLASEQQAAKAKLTESLEAADQDYIESFTRTDGEMRTKADAVANKISAQLSAIDQTLQRRRQASASTRISQLEHLNNRLTKGIRLGIDRMNHTTRTVQDRFPQWSDVLSSDPKQFDSLDFLPLGWLCIEKTLRSALKAEPSHATNPEIGSADSQSLPELFSEKQLPTRLPVVLHRRLYSGVVIRCSAAHITRAVEMTQQILWRLLSGAAPRGQS